VLDCADAGMVQSPTQNALALSDLAGMRFALS